ncbi:hypothetical protein ACOYA6_06390 [Leclercia barmai]
MFDVRFWHTADEVYEAVRTFKSYKRIDGNFAKVGVVLERRV